MAHYFRIKESFRDAEGRVRIRLMLAAGFLPELTTGEICDIRRGLIYLLEQSGELPGQQHLFDHNPMKEMSETVYRYVNSFWKEMKQRVLLMLRAKAMRSIAFIRPIQRMGKICSAHEQCEK